MMLRVGNVKDEIEMFLLQWYGGVETVIYPASLFRNQRIVEFENG